MEYKNYEFRAVTISTNGVENKYISVPIQKAKSSYTTIGLYEKVEDCDEIEFHHIADMSREDFRAVVEFRFPNGFESWQETHFEIVERFTYVCILNYKEKPRFITELEKMYGEGIISLMLKTWTDDFENENKERSWKGEYRKAVREFVNQRIKEVEIAYTSMS